MRKRPNIVVVGSLMLDLVAAAPRVPDMGESVIGTSFYTAPGGKGANQAVQCARLGAGVTMAGCVGEDAFGAQVLETVSASGVDISHVKTTKEHTTGTTNIHLEVRPTGVQNRILSVPGANFDLTVDDLDWLRDSIRDFDLMMLQLEVPMEVTKFAARCAHEAGIPVMLNPAPAAPLDAELLSCVTWLSPNETEAAAITGHPLRVTRDGVDASDLEEVVRILRGKGVDRVIVTLGENGSVFCDGSRTIRSECVPSDEVRDPTAAGDSFVAAFCVGITAGLSEEEALRFAGTAASITVYGTGAMPSLPDLAQVRENLARHSCPAALLEKLNALD